MKRESQNIILIVQQLSTKQLIRENNHKIIYFIRTEI